MPLSLFDQGPETSPPQDFTWFVYGSSLDAEAFRAWAAQHGHVPPDFSRAIPSRLRDYRLCVNVASRYWGGAVGSLAPRPGAWVEGLALALPGSARGLADHKEGAVSGLYRPLEVSVEPLAGGPRLAAVAYVASPEHALPEEGTPPSSTWLATVVRGARAAGLSAEWVATLERLRGQGAAGSLP